MKIRCDVCDREVASVFCSADEAALCDGCDRRVHYANKLASKHTRFSLLQPSFKESPLCDICQEKRAFLFCQEDRAVLCRECDIPIHRANEHTQKHNRFLLTGVKLSASSSLYPSSAAATSTSSETAANNTMPSTRRGRAVSSNHEISSSSGLAEISPLPSTSDNGSYSTSSISEYLMETLPGWHVEEFLDPPTFASNGYCKTNNNSPFMPTYVDDDKSYCSSVSSHDFADKWVPQNSSTMCYSNDHGVFSALNFGLKDQDMLSFNHNLDDITSTSDTVPQITHPTFKRERHFR